MEYHRSDRCLTEIVLSGETGLFADICRGLLNVWDHNKSQTLPYPSQTETVSELPLCIRNGDAL